MENSILTFLTCGSVDDGKSTLIGRLLYDTNSLYTDTLEVLHNDFRSGAQKGIIDYSLLTDGLLSERDQGITIDIAYKYFDTENRKFIIADTPGHEQYTRNMITAASNSDLAIILVDATKGITIQTKRHFFICTLFGIKNIIVAINKMDLVNYQKSKYLDIVDEFKSLFDLSSIDISLQLDFIPISALHGENITFLSNKMSWYTRGTLLDFLENFEVSLKTQLSDFILPIQYVNRNKSSFRGYCGTIINGSISIHDHIKVLPSCKTSTIKELIYNRNKVETVMEGEAVTILLDDQLDINRGDILVSQNTNIEVTNSFDTTIVYMDEEPYIKTKEYELKIATKNINIKVFMKNIINMTDFKDTECDSIKLNDIVKVRCEVDYPIPITLFESCQSMGSFILIDKYSNKTVAVGIITKLYPQQKHIFKYNHTINKKLREKNLNQKPFILWFTGLSGSGKSTLANEIEKELYSYGLKTYLLDGDNLRNGLNSDLAFSLEDREENIRRVAHIASLMVDAGLIVIAAFISPFEKERCFARSLVSKHEFIEIFIDTPFEVCKLRDTKGLYEKAEKGIIKDFTGVNSPYETPLNPQIHIESLTLAKSVQKIMEYLKFKEFI